MMVDSILTTIFHRDIEVGFLISDYIVNDYIILDSNVWNMIPEINLIIIEYLHGEYPQRSIVNQIIQWISHVDSCPCCLDILNGYIPRPYKRDKMCEWLLRINVRSWKWNYELYDS